jgi:hypothetical protein
MRTGRTTIEIITRKGLPGRESKEQKGTSLQHTISGIDLDKYLAKYGAPISNVGWIRIGNLGQILRPKM